MMLFPEYPVLIVDDEESELKSFETALKLGGITNIIKCMDSREVLSILSNHEIECILLDIIKPHISGEELLPELQEKFPEFPVIIVTGIDEVETAVECMKKGAWHYMVKPIEKSHLVSHVNQLIELNRMKRKYSQLRRQFFSDNPDNPEAFKEIITNDAKMKSIFQYIEVIASSPEPVLVTGETGVGKELIARVIHKLSNLKGKFVAVNVAGVDDNIFSDTLFGHEKGAFTDAVRTRRGMIQTACGGTLFLDEIGDLSTASQVKLLRMLQENEYFPLGSDIPRYTDALVPPLRERFDDIPLLVDHFLEEASGKFKKKKPSVPGELFSFLETYGFPGNIRELRAMVLEAVSSQKSVVFSLKPFREVIGSQSGGSLESPGLKRFKSEPGSLVTFSHSLPTLRQVEELLIEEAMERSGGNQTIAARILGISRQALNNRLHRKK